MIKKLLLLFIIVFGTLCVYPDNIEDDKNKDEWMLGFSTENIIVSYNLEYFETNSILLLQIKNNNNFSYNIKWKGIGAFCANNVFEELNNQVKNYTLLPNITLTDTIKTHFTSNSTLSISHLGFKDVEIEQSKQDIN